MKSSKRSSFRTQRTPTCSNMVSAYGMEAADILLLDASIGENAYPLGRLPFTARRRGVRVTRGRMRLTAARFGLA
jgi:hypothetical protein